MANTTTNINTPLPPFINGAEVNSFAAFTLTKRLPYILATIVEDNLLTEKQVAELKELEQTVLNGTITLIHSLFPMEQPFWQAFFEEYAGLSYYQAPFFPVEAYFYRRIMEIIHFVEEGYQDPFLEQKTQNLRDNAIFMEQTVLELHSQPSTFDGEYFQNLLKINLWGNTADLSQMAVHRKVEITSENQVVDKSPALLAYLQSVESLARVDIIADNAGLELVTDLLLSDYLLRTGKAKQVVFHLKYHPTFVSDATIPDFHAHITFFEESGFSELNQLGIRLKDYLAHAQILVKHHLFWNSPLHFTHFPPDLTEDLSESGLLILKGDANYRRLFEDRQWPINQSVEALLSYLPAPALLLRMLKSEIVVGMEIEKGQKLVRKDENWLTNGKFGLIDFVGRL
jgi:uncharacterized protein with ATP-grasp and redox domains